MSSGPPPPPPGPPPAELPQQPQHPQGLIELHLQGNVMTAGMISPSVRVNGHGAPTRYGTTMLPVYAGRNHLDVSMQWMRTYGQAAIDVDVAPGQTVPVWYAPPFHQFARGDIGWTRQRRRGGLGFVAIVAVIVLLVVLVAVAGALG